MAKEADPGDTHYPTITLNIWFAISSILLVGSVFWMVIDDWNREWKQWQRKHQEMEADKLEALLKSYNEDPKLLAEMTSINEEIRAAEASLQSSKKDLESATEELRKADGAKYNADNAQRVAKGDYDWTKYQVEEYRIKNPGQENARRAEVDAAAAKSQAAKLAFEAADRDYESAKAKRNAILASRSKAEARLMAATLERSRHERNLELLRPKTLEGKLAKGVRDFPGVDFAAPSITVNKVVLEDRLFFDLKFPGKKKTRVDMCMTCHVPIDSAGADYAAAANPLKAHPRLDLFLASSSPHPMNDFGCTVCHAGSGETLSFVHADHNPRDAQQRKEWEEKHHWHKMHHWEAPMLPLQHTEASCYQCHSGHMDLIKDEAPRLQRAVELVEKAGCYGCHKIQGVWQDLPKGPGPSLRYLASKVSPDWAYSWVQDPTKFRPSTWMPQIFHLSNATDPTRAKDRVTEREDVAVNAILEYLWAKSEEFAVPAPPVKGDAKRGEEAIQLRGCLACHQVEGLNVPNDTNDFGPDLSGLGSKLSENWIFQWVKNPKKYWPDTKMPDLRLSDQDAADIASYLASLKMKGWDPKRPAVDEALLSDLAKEYLGNQISLSTEERKLKAALAAGGAERRETMLYVGKKFILRQGCFGCHDIPGFEKETPIGTELSDWGSKDLDKLDFGNFLFTHPPRMEKRRDAWAAGKLADPRVFDQGKIKTPEELLKMPKFRFTEEEVQIVTTFLLGLVKNEIPMQSMPRLSESKKALAKGAALVRQNNCMGCHVFQHEKVTMKHPTDGKVSVRGSLSFDEDAEEYQVQLREVAPSFAERTDKGVEGGEVGKGISFPKDQFVSKQPAEGGGIFDSFYKLAAKGLRLEDEKGEPVTRPLDASAAEPYGPPSLRWEGRRVQADWLYEFLKNPTTIRPHVPVRMPTFGFTDEEASALSQYFVRWEEQRYAGEFTRRFRQANAMSRADLAAKAKIGRDAKDGMEILERLESGGRVPADIFLRIQALASETNAKLPQGEHFAFETAQRLPFEPIAETAEAYVAERERSVKDYFGKARNLAQDGNSGNCFSCHWQDGKPLVADPFAWAPDLAKVSDRMRPEWVHRWMTDPSQVIPNTKMPKPGIGPGKSDAIFPGSFEDSVQALVDYLMNYDRVPPASKSAQ